MTARPAAAERVIELDIHGIAAGGDGVGRSEGMVVFVPRTAPGDRARVRIVASLRFARGTLLDVVRPAPDRAEPPCPHYSIDRCGGCQLQHLRYEAQLAAKAAIVRDALRRIGKRDVELPVFQLDDCPITDERVLITWREIAAAAAYLPPADGLRGAVRLVRGGATIVIEGGTSWPKHDAFLDSIPSAVALWWKPEEGARRLIGERAHAPAGASFTQVNAAVADDLRVHTLARVRAHRPSTVVDAYAGIGDTAAPLAESGIRVVAIELDREAAARCAARLSAGSRAVAGKVEDVLPRVLPADVVLLNPPRTGVDERVTSALARQAPPPRAIVYVSCDPATLARDVARLPRFRVASLVAFDMFPQTAHVETVCELVPEAA